MNQANELIIVWWLKDVRWGVVQKCGFSLFIEDVFVLVAM